MSSNSTGIELPPSLNLPPHLSAQKYFLVCTLTVAAWDTLVLSPRNWRLMKTGEWPILKIIFHFLRVFMPVEFTIVAVAFFDTKWSQATCQHFFLFEPICTAILLAATSAVHVIRTHAIYDKNRPVLIGMGCLYAVQIVVTAICCGFYRSVPLDVGQGCIAGPKHNWVGIYWLAPTLLYTASFALALRRSIVSLKIKPLTPWKLMLRDGLNLYGAVWGINMANVLFWFIMKPTGIDDPIKTIITSMAAVLTTSMTLRIILNVRGSLKSGGVFTGGTASSGHSSSRTTHVISTRSGGRHSSQAAHTYNLEDMRTTKPEPEWPEPDAENKVIAIDGAPMDPNGVKITVDREVGYDQYHHAK
ncbi:hypothetical protein F5050DRAFT_533939 [Lentinula boryana]|uniref:DUF6533 domain-containing protein n=1 Tax=Lentinula boryana TaxID=40481 RepID=A0ABQ8QPE5_9AGAR|nr:hypothetical protein F5050DRAFT_533939 [Lentinula boryana]